MIHSLTFIIRPAETEEVSLDLFQKTIEDIRRLVKDIDYAVTRERGKRRWVIEALHSSSPAITIRPLLENEELIETIVQGISDVSEGTADPPKHFNEPSLEDLKRMRRLFHGKDRVKNVELKHEGMKTAIIREDIEEKVGKILAGGYSALGSIEGILEAVNLHGGRPTFTIWDNVSGAPVRCFFPKTTPWVKQVEELLEKIVIVRGVVNYFKNGLPRSISNIRDISDETKNPNLPKATFGSLSSDKPIENIVDFLTDVREGA